MPFNDGSATTSDNEKSTVDNTSAQQPSPPPPPPNGGLKAWIQVLGAHFLFFNSWGLVNSFGVFQTYYQDDLLKSSNASDISWIGTFQAFLLVALSVIVGPIFDRGYSRTLIIVGTFFTVFGTMMQSLGTKYYQIFLAQGLTIGLGTGFIFLPSVAIVATYFTTKRALAIGITASGGSLGSVIYPIVFERLQPRIGFPWATRVLGFISLATLMISIAVMRTRLPPPKQARALLDLRAFKNMPYSFYSLGLFLSFAGLYIPIFYIIIWAQRHANVDSTLSFYLLAILNAASIFGRIIPGLIADKYGSLETAIACTLIAGILGYVAIVIKNLGGLIVFAILYGFVSGAVVSLPSAIVASLTPDMKLVGTWMGQSFFLAALGILIGSPIAGTIINVPANKFSDGFIFSATLVMGAGVSYIVAKVLKTKEQRAKV
ncbi:major facilitator superfamily domain-containing protein [Trichoderma sp. SZMC 28014]